MVHRIKKAQAGWVNKSQLLNKMLVLSKGMYLGLAKIVQVVETDMSKYQAILLRGLKRVTR